MTCCYKIFRTKWWLPKKYLSLSRRYCRLPSLPLMCRWSLDKTKVADELLQPVERIDKKWDKLKMVVQEDSDFVERNLFLLFIGE